MRVKILGKFWNLLFVPPSKITRTDGLPNNGVTDSPSTKNKSMKINTECEGEKKLETLIHEMLHAANWHLDEEFVAESSEDIARVLWRLGYRETVLP